MTQAAPQPNAALGRNAEAAREAAELNPPPVAQRLDIRREMTVREFTSHYDIRADQIFFDAGSDEPYFDFEALSLLVNELADFPRIVVTPTSNDHTLGIASASCEITLPNGNTRSYTGSALIGEPMPGGGTVEDWRSALAVAQVRALRTALRSVSFNPVRAHEAKKNGVELEFNITDPRQRELREAHSLGVELEFIKGDDKAEWRRQIYDFTQGRLDSMEKMDDVMRGHFLLFLRALKRHLRARGVANS